MPKAKKRTVTPAKKTGSSLAATIRAELAKPVIPGQILFAAGDLDALNHRQTKELTVKNSADRPIQVGSHCHFFEVNRGLVFDREQAFGYQPECYAPTGWLAGTMDKWSGPKSK